MSEVPLYPGLDVARTRALSWSRIGVSRCKATWKREFKLPWRETGPPNHHDDKVDSDQQVVNKELSHCSAGGHKVPGP